MTALPVPEGEKVTGHVVGPANIVPGAYRGVAVATVDFALDGPALQAHFIGREAYYRTRFIVIRNGWQTAIAAVHKGSDKPLFSPVTELRLLAGPADCVYLEAPEVDTAVPTALAHVAVTRARDVRGVVVHGRYGHVSFIIDPAPLRVTVHEIVPPHPPKLVDQTLRALDLAEDLPPIEVVPDVLELRDLAHRVESAGYLLPCRGGEASLEPATTDYLDEHPPLRPWTLVGCERSQQIHEWFYGRRAPQVDICPRKRPPGPGATLSKCCLLESGIEAGGKCAVVPWGASLAQVSEALTALAREWEPTWAPV